MKTNFISLPIPPFKFLISFFSIVSLTACGTYVNSSYYDTDGIYGTTNAGIRTKVIDQESSIAYQNYFSALQDSNEANAIITDISNYNSYSNSNNQDNSIAYPSWGSNSNTININYNPNNWGWSYSFGSPFYGLGWRNPYYAGYYPFNYWNDPYMMGWGFNNFFGYNYYSNYFWGYPNYTPHYIYVENSYRHNASRRGSNYNDLNPSGSNIGRREIQNSTTNYTNRSAYSRPTNSPIFSRNANRFENQNFINNNINRTRVNTSNDANTYPVRTNSRNNSNSTRNYTPSNNDSYTPSRSSNNSSYSSGNYGGGRSYDGGGRRGGR